ncbi:MAG TPA: DUF72 domain-containing protein [Gemmatimonadaceae bacterium]|jgi:uncharacterized protein YecE (DUF72 family)|nr:DUF72 domain-containing protein [Gemmatimonadaceae bacterium]
MTSPTDSPAATLRIGTAGWGLPRQWRGEFPAEGSYLERYATLFSAVEINSSFYRQHKRAVYERWASAVPVDFRFAVKLPRAITHDQALVASDVLLDVFLEDATGLGARLGPLLVQLPPSLAYDAERVDDFFRTLRTMHEGAVACEPRHESWFTAAADAMLRAHRIARVAADPARVPAAAEPGGDPSLEYFRLHGSPRMYYSDYEAERLAAYAQRIARRDDEVAERWCIFDNTTLGAATGNALALARLAHAA